MNFFFGNKYSYADMSALTGIAVFYAHDRIDILTVIILTILWSAISAFIENKMDKKK